MLHATREGKDVRVRVVGFVKRVRSRRDDRGGLSAVVLESVIKDGWDKARALLNTRSGSELGSFLDCGLLCDVSLMNP